MVEQTKAKAKPAGPVTGERAPVLHVLAPSTPMAQMIREKLAADDAAVDLGESEGSPALEA